MNNRRSIRFKFFILTAWSLTTLWLLPLFLASPASAADRSEDPKSAPESGISTRVPWTSSRVVGSPEPPSPYLANRVFPALHFQSPVDMCNAPGTSRLFVAEQAGSIYSFLPQSPNPRPEVFFRLAERVAGLNSLYGIAFHPGFETNRYVYLCYVLKDGLPDGSRVSRFTVSQTDPPQIEPASERIILTWLSGGHNGGCLKFGGDGFLYISTGDGGGPNPPDPMRTGQDNSDLLSSILRIDVDATEGNRGYRIPSDNPFVNRQGTRPEIWAYGLRNPWRMSFDSQTGALWVADVGWELWEMVYLIERGGNYGWSIVEGPQSIHPDWPRGPTPILPPLKAHPHTEAASITGGLVYRGKKLNKLVGSYIYGDWVTGKIWAMRAENGKLTSLDELVDTPLQIVCFAEDNSRELFAVDYGGGIYQLAPNSTPSTHLAFPKKLSETGLFASVPSHTLAPGVLPFQVNVEMWADHAVAERFVGLPDTSSIQTGAKNVWLFQTKNEWRYPTNAVLGKTLSLALDRQHPEKTRRLETQLLHFDGLDWHAYSYRWNEAQTDAELVGTDGDEISLQITDASIPEGHRQQSWRFHSRAECLRCHNPWVNVALAFTAPQLNRPAEYRADSPSLSGPGGRSAHQLRTFSHLGYFDQGLDERSKPKFTNPYDANANITERARSWLHVNCSHCHREGAGGSVVSHFDYDTPPREMKAIGHVPSQGTLGLTNAHVITPGRASSSVMFYRTSTTGQGRMPLIGSREVDVHGTQLLYEWIGQMSSDLSEDKAEANGSPMDASTARALQRLRSKSAAPGEIGALLDQLLSTPSSALELLELLNEHPDEFAGFPELLARVAQHPSFQVRDLFERFLPESQRPHKLGLNIKPDEILALKGSAERGKGVFLREDVQCTRCHRIQGQGREFGPDLSRIGSKYSRSQLLDQILNPSKQIDPAFVTYQLETADGSSYAGFLVKRTSEELLLKDADLKEIRVPTAQVKTLQAQQLSAMPEGLLQSMTSADVANLLEFLSSLKEGSTRE